MKVDNKCKKDLLFFSEIEHENFSDITENDNDLYFYYKKVLYNTSDFNLSTSEDYDGMIKMKNGNYLLIKYLDDDQVCVGEIN